MIARRALPILLALSAAAASRAQEPAGFTVQHYESSDGEKLNYRLFTPEGYDKSPDRYPLVVWMHDYYAAGDDNRAQIMDTDAPGATVWTTAENQERHPCFVLAPQCPRNPMWISLANGTPSKRLRLIPRLIGDLEKLYPLDRDRVYLAGQSIGAFAVWGLLRMSPGTFAAAVPVAGGGDPADAPRIAGIPVWAFHGGIDRVVPTDRSREMVAALKKAGGNPRYTEFAHLGHELRCWQAAFQNPDLIEWLFSQRKVRVTPKT
jgi:predicted peptidase